MSTTSTAKPSADKAAGCIMCDSLYVKPDGGMPCWDDVGEDLILRRLDEQALIDGRESPVFASPALARIRRAFLDGRVPHEDFCTRCPLYGHGVARELEPKVMNVLHVEPVYLCQLACPQCFTPKERLRLKKPPYYMSLDFYRALLEQLRREGVEHIRFVHFEGRGEPLLHQELGEMIEATKELYPESFVMVTSHGNFPYRPWMHTSGLDVLRLSVDGAFEESYQRYRVGGTLAKPLRLMADVREKAGEHPQSRLRIEWKYILFEWNDGDDELRRAAELASERGVRLRFCLTHTPGRSRRFESEEELAREIPRLAPGAGIETTFQLRSEPSEADSSHVLAEHAEALLVAALACLRRGDDGRARQLLAEALERDLGLGLGLGVDPDGELAESSGDSAVDPLDRIWNEELERLVAACRFPAAAVALANIAQFLSRWHAAEALYRRYLQMAPEAGDRQKIEATALELAIGNRLGRHVEQADETSRAHRRRAVAVAVELDAGLPRIAARWPGALYWLRRRVASSARPHTLLQLAHLREADGDARTALYWLDAATRDQALDGHTANWRERLRRRLGAG